MSRVITFTVKGESLGKGSMQPKTFQGSDGRWRSSVRHNNPNLMRWQACIAGVAQSVVDDMPFLEPIPVRVEVTFYLGPPQRPEHEKPVTGRDLDKLARLGLDAMTGVLYSDDRQVTDLHVKKRYAANRQPRAEFRISEDDEVVEIALPLKKVRAPALTATQSLIQ